MAALSPERVAEGKSAEYFCAFSRNNWLAETPPAKAMDLTSGYSFRAISSFSRRISVATFSKDAAKSAT